MYSFTFERPATLADAASLASGGATLLAGGQTLLASMKLRLSDPGQLADLGAIKELSCIRRDGNSLVIGAMTRHLDVADSAEVKAAIPALADLAARAGMRYNLGGYRSISLFVDEVSNVINQPLIEILNKGAELLARREGWVVPTPRYPKGFLAKYAKLAQGAELGAITR